MTENVTSFESWTKQAPAPKGGACWNCKVGTYITYESDDTKTPRCGQCGELEQDAPAKTKPAVKRAVTKPKDKV